jgi:hypothetical protein
MSAAELVWCSCCLSERGQRNSTSISLATDSEIRRLLWIIVWHFPDVIEAFTSNTRCDLVLNASPSIYCRRFVIGDSMASNETWRSRCVKQSTYTTSVEITIFSGQQKRFACSYIFPSSTLHSKVVRSASYSSELSSLEKPEMPFTVPVVARTSAKSYKAVITRFIRWLLQWGKTSFGIFFRYKVLNPPIRPSISEHQSHSSLLVFSSRICNSTELGQKDRT